MGFTNSQHDMSAQLDQSLKMIEQTLYQQKSSPWLDLRVFYVRVSNFEVTELTPEQLTLIYVPLGPQTILRVNGKRNSAYLDHVCSRLKRDRVDKNSEEAIFVNTDCVEVTGNVGFEVLDGEDLLISGVVGLHNAKGFAGNNSKKWTLNCHSHMVANGPLKGRKSSYFKEVVSPLADIYVAGSFYGSPIILSKTIELLPSPKNNRKVTLDTIPEHETTDVKKYAPSDALQDSILDYTPEDIHDRDDFHSRYHLACYQEDENGELSWFNAGVRVGVGISLGICIGVGIGVGLLAKTYQATSGRFRRRLLF